MSAPDDLDTAAEELCWFFGGKWSRRNARLWRKRVVALQVLTSGRLTKEAALAEANTDTDMTTKPPICESAVCKWKGRPMELRQPATPEQEFCVAGGGELWCCDMCRSSSLSPGRDLLAFLATMQAPKAQGELSLQPNA